MNKRLLPIFLLSAISTGALAQPVITSSSNPIPGDDFTYRYSNMANPGPAGAGQIWDFSAATEVPGEAPFHFSVITCAAAPDCGDYAGANLAWKINDTTHNYQLANEAGIRNIGSRSGTSANLTYTDPDQIIRYPFAYGNSYSDTMAGTYVLSMFGTTFSYNRYGTSLVQADAYGSLKTPAGTFENVLRVHRHQVIVDSQYIGGMWVPMPYTMDNYEWYSTSSHMPLYTVSIANNDGEIDQTAQWLEATTGIGSISGLQSSISVFPQPAKGTINLKFTSERAAMLSIQLTDITGRVLQTVPSKLFNAGQNETSIDVSTLSAGFYLLQLTEGAQRVAAQKIVVQ